MEVQLKRCFGLPAEASLEEEEAEADEEKSRWVSALRENWASKRVGEGRKYEVQVKNLQMTTVRTRS